MKRRSCRTEFPTLPIPDGIDRLVRLGVLKDVSSASDTCPSFEMHRHDQAVTVWIDHPDPERREFRAPTRFAVEALVKDGETGWWVFPDPAQPLLETDSAEELLAFIGRFEREPLAASCS